MGKRNLLALVMTLVILSLASPTYAADSQFYGRIDAFRWKEVTPGGSEFMHESGPLVTLGFKNQKSYNTLKTTTNVEVFGGAPTHYEAAGSSKNNYYGFKLEVNCAKLGDSRFVEPFVGVGWKRWTRSLDTTPGYFLWTPFGYYGYSENWSSVYTKAGLRQQAGNCFWQAGVTYPILTRNRVDLLNCTFKPKSTLGYFAEIGIDHKNSRISFTYEYQKYKQSDLERGMAQPESTSQTFGLQFTRKF